ncbi:uncharacterized protein LOC128178130 [Crassostrea angulata]|uniref:uncharacterized protein LOC128178130 n=1 Tax=Magallana angulata TaxID=2784310 RepID=UPI0022B11367|nr:uncharacterized protein LOC128178130 [Crassostrea angulata]
MRTSYNLQERSSSDDFTRCSFKVTNVFSINENGASLNRMSAVDGSDVIAYTEADEKNNRDKHNDSLITDLDDVSIVCENEDINAEKDVKESGGETSQSRGQNVSNLEGKVIALREDGPTEDNDKDEGLVTIGAQENKTTRPTDKMENGQVTGPRDDKEVIADIDMEAIKEYILKIVNHAQEIVQNESKETAKPRVHRVKPWTQRLAEIFCFRRK